MLNLKRILVPVDFSKEAELSVDWAVKLASGTPDAKIYLLHVIPINVTTPETAYLAEVALNNEWELAEWDLEQWKLKVPPPLHAVALCGRGNVEREIFNVCKNENIDLVVMTTHGREGVSRWIHPNATELVVRSAYCPVLALHFNRQSVSAVKSEGGTYGYHS